MHRVTILITVSNYSTLNIEKNKRTSSYSQTPSKKVIENTGISYEKVDTKVMNIKKYIILYQK